MPTDEQYQSFLYWLGFDKLIILLFVAIVLLTVATLILLPSFYNKKKRTRKPNSIQRGIKNKMMTEKTAKTLATEDFFDPLVKISFKVPFSVREQLKKQAITQGKNLDKFMEELINRALTDK